MTEVTREEVQEILGCEEIIPEVVAKAIDRQTGHLHPDEAKREILIHMVYLADRPGWEPGKIGTRVTVLDRLLDQLQAQHGDLTQQDKYGLARDRIIDYVASDGDYSREGTPHDRAVLDDFARVCQFLEG